MNRHVRTVATLLPIISLTLLLAGCPKRPAMTAATAPPPVPPAAVAPPTPAAPAPAPAPVAPAPVAPPTAAPAPAPAPPAPPKEYRSNAALQQIFFAFDKADIRPGDAQILAASAAYLKANPNQLVLIEGHCDERGTSEYNLALGEWRAKVAYEQPRGQWSRGLPDHHDLLRQGAPELHPEERGLLDQEPE